MSYNKRFVYRKKVIGGSILGNLYDSAKNAIYSGAKMALKKGKELFNIGTRKAIDAGKELLKKGVEEGKDYVTKKVSDLADRGVQNIIEKAKGRASEVSKKLTPEMRESIKAIATNPNVKKILTNKTKEVLAKIPINDKSRAILDNIIAGSGVKRLK